MREPRSAPHCSNQESPSCVVCSRSTPLLLGAFTDIAGLTFTLYMLGAITFVHAKNGFSVARGGMEWPLLLLASALAIALAGPGRYAVGRPADR